MIQAINQVIVTEEVNEVMVRYTEEVIIPKMLRAFSFENQKGMK